MIKVSFEVGMDLWSEYVAYAMSYGKTVSEMLHLHVAETVCLNQKRIDRFNKEVDALVKRLNEEENQK